MDPITIRHVDASDTHDLRHAVLRPDAPRSDVEFDGDLHPDTRHIGAFRGGELHAIASVYREAPGWRLRGMASSTAARGTGAGAAVLAAAEAYVREQGGVLLWCNARIEAVGFYERFGWRVTSSEFDIPGVGPHVVMDTALV